MKNKTSVLKKAGIILVSIICGLITGGLAFAFINRFGPEVEYWIPHEKESAVFIKVWLLLFVLTPAVFLMSLWIGIVSHSAKRWLAMMSALFCGPLIARTIEYAIQFLIGDQSERLFEAICLSYIANIGITLLCLALAQKHTKSPSTIATQLHPIKIQFYIALLKQFIESRMSPAEFETAYLDLYLNDPTQWTVTEFFVLDELFAAVDSFCADPDLREKNDLDERQLLEAAKKALAKIY